MSQAEPLPAVSKPETSDLSPRQEHFTRLYYAGPEELRGNATRCYLEAYETNNRKTAATEGSRLLKRPDVRARIREIRDEAAEAAKERARDWWELYPKAQRTLERAASGELPGDDQDKRSAVEAAKEIVARCLGSVKIQHEHSLSGQAIVAHVAGEPAEERQEDDGREIPSSGPRIEPAD